MQKLKKLLRNTWTQLQQIYKRANQRKILTLNNIEQQIKVLKRDYQILELSLKKSKSKDDDKADQAAISNIDVKIKQIVKEVDEIRIQMNGFRQSIESISILHHSQDKNVDDYIASSQVTRLMTKADESSLYRMKDHNLNSLQTRKYKRIKSAKSRIMKDQPSKIDNKSKLKCFEQNAPQIHIRGKFKTSVTQGPTPVQSCTTLKSLIKVPSKISNMNQSTDLDLCLMPETMFADYI